jgi:transcriptional regulator with GAF, ATPase, and Fis domain
LSLHARELRVGRFALRVMSGPDAGLSQPSDAEEFVVGTAPGNQLVLKDPTVSRHHLSVTATTKGFLLRDLGSTNGTTVAGLRVEAAYLSAGALVGAGETQLRFELLEDEVHEPLAKESAWARLLGSSPAMRRIFALMPKLAASTSTVLLYGETGTGKGLIAESIHQEGPRATQPFVVIDCGAIPPTLIEAELFGHERGAFTGAHGARAGGFELAQGGTVFLDEIGELPLEMQPKLLRALEERTVKRLGGSERIALDVRVIAATSRDLHQEVNRGTFRSDLFYRLNVVRLRVPPLRERSEDSALLAAHG